MGPLNVEGLTLFNLMPAILPLLAPLEFTPTNHACFFELVHSAES